MRLSSPKYYSPNFFGHAEHGNFESKDTITYLDVPDNGDPCYYFFHNFIINTGHTVTTKQPCRGLYIYVANNAIINGILTMTQRGIYSPPEGEYINGYTPIGLNQVYGVSFTISIGIPGINNLATATQDVTNPGKNGGCGAGGLNIVPSNLTSYRTSQAIPGCAGVFGSGAGAAGHYYGYNIHSGWGRSSTGKSGGDYSGAGAKGYIYSYSYSSCGVGNPTYKFSWIDGAYQTLIDKEWGTAGVIYLICDNYYTTSTSAQLVSTGINAVAAYNSPSNNYGKAITQGGGSGGGSITVLYRRKYGNILYDISAGNSAGAGCFREYQIL